MLFVDTPDKLDPELFYLYLMGNEVKLRPWSLTDLHKLVALADNPNIARFMVDAFPSPYTRESGRLFIKNANSEEPKRILCIEYKGDVAGSIGVHLQTDIMRMNAEIGYWIGEPYWGNGIATSAVKLITEYAFNNFNITRLFARPYEINKASQRVLEKAGYIVEARIEKNIIKNGVILDEIIYAKRKK